MPLADPDPKPLPAQPPAMPQSAQMQKNIREEPRHRVSDFDFLKRATPAGEMGDWLQERVDIV